MILVTKLQISVLTLGEGETEKPDNISGYPSERFSTSLRL